MLLNLHIKDYALIDDLSIAFTPGLNILTGETGTGKSIIIDAINLIIGERASTDFIRTGKQSACVEAVFDYDNTVIDTILREYGIEPEEKTLIISREVSSQGRSYCRLNGKMVPVSALKKTGQHLIDIHGQHQHQSLLNQKNHIRLLDLLGYEDISKTKKNVRILYKKYCEIKQNIDVLIEQRQEFQTKQERLKYEIDELEKAHLQTGEEDLLEEEKNMLENAESIFEALEFAYRQLYQGYEIPAIVDSLNKIVGNFEEIKEYYQSIEPILEELKNILYELDDISSTIRNLRDSINFDTGKLNRINARLELLDRLKSKYNKSISELLIYKDQAAAELDKTLNLNEQINELNSELENIKSDLTKWAVELHYQRKKIAKKLQDNISNELNDLGMKNVKFYVSITFEKDSNGIEIEGKKVRVNEEGIDNVEFLISTNPGEPLKPLKKIISGGESSRIMLALKSIMAKVDHISCLIFDEVDAGIGGRTAQVVGEKLSKLSKNHQILCVTHSPQIASLGDTHFLINKETKNNKTFTKVCNINGQERITELARMLGGAEITENTLIHAQEMLKLAKKIKEF